MKVGVAAADLYGGQEGSETYRIAPVTCLRRAAEGAHAEVVGGSNVEIGELDGGVVRDTNDKVFGEIGGGTLLILPSVGSVRSCPAEGRDLRTDMGDSQRNGRLTLYRQYVQLDLVLKIKVGKAENRIRVVRVIVRDVAVSAYRLGLGGKSPERHGICSRSRVVIHRNQQVVEAVVEEWSGKLYLSPPVGDKIHISAEHEVGGRDIHPADTGVKDIHVGVYHVDVEVAGRGITGVVKRDVADITHLADFRCRVNLFCQGIVTVGVRRQKNIRAGAVADMYMGGIGYCLSGETHLIAPVAGAVNAAVGPHFHGIVRFRRKTR